MCSSPRTSLRKYVCSTVPHSGSTRRMYSGSQASRSLPSSVRRRWTTSSAAIRPHARAPSAALSSDPTMFRGVPGRRGAKTPADMGHRGAIIVLGMSPLGVILLVVGILAVVLLMLVPILGWARRRSRRIEAELAAELAGEPPLIGPEKASYRGGSGPYPKVKGNGVIVLTER